MAGEDGQDINNILVGDQLERVSQAVGGAMKSRAILLAIRLDLPVQTGNLLRVPGEKEFSLQIGQSHPNLGAKSVPLRKSNTTTHLNQCSRVEFPSEQLARYRP
jgi:hypothetical protein